MTKARVMKVAERLNLRVDSWREECTGNMVEALTPSGYRFHEDQHSYLYSEGPMKELWLDLLGAIESYEELERCDDDCDCGWNLPRMVNGIMIEPQVRE